ncbi:MAG: hypothetical protein AMXMBFR53_02270 [Gemmatimonadota bacterium]
MRRWRRSLVAVEVALAAAGLVACDGPTEVVTEVGAVTVSPAQKALLVGDSVVLRADVRAPDGTPMEGVALAWTVSDTTVARATFQANRAVVRAVKAGSVVVQAGAGGKNGRAELTVSEAPGSPVAEVRLTPGAVVMSVGEQRAFSARAYDAAGGEITGLATTWVNDSPGVLALSDAGVATAVAPGYGQVTAKIEGVSASVAVTVTAPEPAPAVLVVGAGASTLRAGQQVALRAVLLSSAGDTLPLAGIQWAGAGSLSVAPLAATGYAVGTAQAAGTGTVIARVGQVEGRLVIPVTAGEAVSSIQMRPETLLAEVGVDITLGIHAWHPDGAFFADPAASWVSSDPTIAVATGTGPRGVVRGLRAGTVEITAAVGGVTARSVVTVKAAGPVGHVIVTPAKGGIWEGSLYRMRAATLWANGGELPGQPVAWSVEDTTVATIEADGLLLTKKPGTTRVFARSGGRQGVGEIRVHATPGDVMVFDLAPTEGPAGEWRPLVSLGDTTWTDPEGTAHVAHRFLVGGTLEVIRAPESRWTQVLKVETMVIFPSGPKVVAHTLLNHQGTWGFGFDDPWHLFFTSTERTGYGFEGKMHEAGRFVVRQTLEGPSALDFTWLLR